MPTQGASITVAGGLDLVSSSHALFRTPGAATILENFESATTGGYRRIPIMQIGAYIYCDTSCILYNLEKLYPDPTFFPQPLSGISSLLGSWSDIYFFNQLLIWL